ncbi:MAG: putative Ig domain-containing protein [Planctomycetales bacterium]
MRISGAGTVGWRLVDPYGNNTFSASFNNDVNVTVPQPGNYILVLEELFGNTSTINYTFNVQATGNTPPTPPTGAALTLGTTVSDSIAVAGEQDKYLFTLASPSLLYFDALTNNGNLNWSLVGPAGAAVTNRQFTGSDGGSFIFGNPVLNVVAGTYQLTLAASGSNTGAYQFRLWDLAQASPLTPGTPVSGDLNPANETDLYRFTAAAGDRFYFDVTAFTGTPNARWRLFDPYGNSIFNQSFNSTNLLSDVDVTTLTRPGTYTLLLEGHVVDTVAGAYTLNVQPVTVSTTPLTLGQTVSGAIGAAGEQDQYTFNLAAAGLYYFDSLINNSSLNWSLAGPAGAAVTSRGVSASDGATLTSNPTLNLIAGAYTLTVDAGGDGTGAYQFRLLDLADAVSFTPGTALSGALNPANETDLVRFTAAAGDRFFFDVTARTGGSGSKWRLVDPYGNLLFTSGFDTTTSFSDVDVMTLSKGGSYTLLLEGAINATAADGYTFNVQPASRSSQAMALGSVVGGSIGLAGEQDQYTFTLAAQALAYFDSLTANGSLTWTLASTTGPIVSNRFFSSSDDGNFTGTPVLNLAAGDYTITVDGVSDATGAYQFRLLNLADATPLTPGTPVDGILTPANGTDLFQFAAAAGDKFFFDVQARTGSISSSWRLVDPSRTILFNKQFNDASSFSDVDTLTLAQSGQYTLLVEGAAGNTGTSTYRFNVQPVTFVSQPLILGSLVNGSIGVPGEQDLYTFSLAKPALLYFDGLSNSGSWALTGPAGTVVSNQSFASGNYPVLNLIAGDYTLAVDGFSDATGSYRFRLSDLAQATSLTPGTPVSGTLNPVDEADLFQFTAAAGDQFFFDVQARSGANSAGWRLADPYGNILFSKSFNSTTSSDVATMTLTQSGNYTLLLEGFVFDTGSGSYTFNVQPMGNSPPAPFTGSALTLGATTSGNIAVAGQQDRYLFTLAERSLLYFDSLTNNSNLNWTLVGPAGTAVSNRSFAGSDAGSLNGNPVLNVVAGTYQLTVAATGSATGAYQFRLWDLAGKEGAAPTPLTLGTPVSGTLDPVAETHLYTFSIAAPGRFAFDFLDRTGSINFRLIDPYGNLVPLATNLDSFFRQALNLQLPGAYTLLLEGGITGTGTQTYSLIIQPTPPTFSPGDVFIGFGFEGTVERFDQDLHLLDILDTQPGIKTGMAFDSSSNLYVTNFSSANLTKFEPSGALTFPNPFVSGDPGGSTESVVFDAAGNFFVGQADGTRDVLKFSPDGVLLDRFDVLREDRGSDWIDLAADQTTLFYTSEDKHILRYDLNTRTQLPSLAKLPGSHAYALRVLPDKSVLVADTDRIVHLNENGQIIRTYTPPDVVNPLFALNLDPDGTSFWSATVRSPSFPGIFDVIYKFDINSGSILMSRRFGGATNGFGGIAVFGEKTAGTSYVDLVATDPAPVVTNLSGPVPGIPGQPLTFQVQFTGDGEAHSFDLLFVRPESNLLLGSIPVTINKQYLYPVQAVDADGDPITFSLLEAPTDAAINAQTGRITFAPPSVGTYRIGVQADDGRGGRDVQEYDVVVTSGAPNGPPTITSTASDEATAGLPFEYRAVATDPDGDLPTYFLTQAPAGMAIDRLTGLITWTPTPSQIGSQTATIRVRDGRGGEATQTFTLSVFVDTGNRAPRIVSAPITTAVGDKLYRYSAFATDEDNDPLRFDLVLAPDRMTVDATSGVVIWRPTAGDVGDNDVILRVRDGRGGVNLQPFQITVNAVGTPPCFSTPGPTASAVVGQPYQYQFRTQDADGDAVTYRLDASPAGMTIDPTTGLLHWTPGMGQVGPHAVIITAIDSTSALVKLSFALEVLLAASNDSPMITSSPRTRTRIGLGATYLYQVAASDPNNDPLTVSLITAPAGMTLDADHLLRWNPEAGQLGDNNVIVRVSDGRGGIVSQSFTVEVVTERANQPPPIVSSPRLTATVGRDYHHQPRGIDTDGDPLFWSLTTFPDGMSIHPALGTLCWTPSADQVGLNPVVVQLDDGQGGFSTQSFTVVVRAVNLPPMFVSTPLTSGTAGRAYAYAARVEDVEGDPLHFQLTTFPEGMTINAATGLIDWTPTTAQLGPQNVAIQVADGQGGNATQTFTIVVVPVPPNQPPTITTLPITAAAAGLAYIYDVDAADPEGDTLTFALDTPPAGMTIDSATGLINWTPAGNQAGDQRITLRVTDSSGKTASQAYTLRVQVANRRPVIHSTAVLSTTAGLVYRYDVKASDPDGNALTYSLTSPPAGMAIDALGRITWSTSIPDVGTRSISVVVTDVFGASAHQTYDLIVTADTEAPQVILLLSENPVDLGTSVTVAVSAIDNVEVTSLTLTNNGVAVPLDRFGRATISGNTAGFFNLFATARDAAGNVGTASDTLVVRDPHVTGAPVVALTAPTENAVVTTFTDIIGTVEDANLISYTLAVAPLGSDSFTVFFTGTTEVTNGVLGTFDPTMLQNDTYVIRLTAINTGGFSSSIETTVHLSQGLKLGNFTLSFNDLQIPVSGIPITMTRTYDTLTASRVGEFGFGWRLEFRDVDLRTSVTPTGYEKDEIYNPFKVGTRVYLTLPGGTREGFTFKPKLADGFRGSIIGIFEPRFVPDSGVTSSLTVTPADLRINADGRVFDFATGQAYNPASSLFGGSYLLTTKDGVAYDVNGDSGLLNKVSDSNNNTLTFSESGIVSSSGPRVTFERDAHGRIAAVIDPIGHRIAYQYDAASNLIAVTDRTDNMTRFNYLSSPAHYLHEVIDPLGRTGVRTEYDAQGRLVQLVNAAGHLTQINYDPSHSVETIVDALGHSRTYEYDARGNVVRDTDALGNTTRWTYDANNNVVTSSDPLGRTTTYSYDDRRNVLTMTDPLGNTTISTYQSFTWGTTTLAARRGEAAPPFTRIISATDPLGNTTTFTASATGTYVSTADALRLVTTVPYDDRGNPVSVTDTMGQTTRLDVDSAGHLLKRTDPLGNATTFTYDANGNQLSSTSTQTAANGTVRTRTSTSAYDPEGRLNSMTDTAGGVTRFEYDAAGNRTASIDPLGRRTNFVYDDRNHVIAIIEPDATPGNLADNPTMRIEYDAVGRTTARIDPLGRRTEYLHDAVGRLVKTIFADGTLSRTVYNAAGQVITEIDPLGQRIEYEYDAAGRRTVVRDPLGNTQISTYDAAGRKVAETDRLGRKTSFVYDALGRLVEIQRPDGTTARNVYDARSRIISRIDPLNQTTQTSYDGLGRVTAETNALGGTTSFTYDESGNLLMVSAIVTAADGSVTMRTMTNEFDRLGRVIAVVDAEGGVTRTQYDAVSNQVATVDPLGRRTEYRYDERNRLIATIYPDATPGDLSDNPTMRFAYDAAGQRTASIDELGRSTAYEYNLLGRLVKTIFADGASSRTEYDANGNIVAEIDERGNRTEFEYDANGRQTVRRNALGQTTTYTYDANGQRLTTTDPLGHVTTFVYDVMRRLVETDFADGTETSTTYDPRGQVIATTDQLGRTTQWERDPLGRVAAIVDPLGQRTEYTYDEVGELIRRRDANGHVMTYEYDGLGRMTAIELPALSGQSPFRSTTQYDAVGNVISTTDFNGDRINYSYDTRNRLVTKLYPDATSVHYAYTATGRPATVTDTRGTTTYAYDARDRLIQATQPDTVGISYSYDAAGNRTALTTPAGTVTYAFDALNRQSAVTDPDGRVTRYIYDASGNLVRTDLPNGTVEARTYSSVHRLTSIVVRNGASIISSFTYILSPTGRRDSVIEADGRRVDYTYDAADRLTQEKITDPVAGNRTFSYTYDPVGNRLAKTDSLLGVTTYVYDVMDRLLTESLSGQTTQYTYDKNGNMLSRASATARAFYVWDFDNRLVAVDTDGNGTIDERYVYDPNGNRVSQTVGGQETRSLIDWIQPNPEVALEYRPDGTIVATYVRGHWLISQTRAGVTSLYHVDGIGSIRTLTDLTGAVAARYVYDAFGNLLAQTGIVVNVYLFAGQQSSATSGLDYMRARHYNPALGRFISADPLRDRQATAGGGQFYVYADNDPANLTDPTGQMTMRELAVTFAIIDGLLTGATEYFRSGRSTSAGLWGFFKGFVTGLIGGAVIGRAGKLALSLGGTTALTSFKVTTTVGVTSYGSYEATKNMKNAETTDQKVAAGIEFLQMLIGGVLGVRDIASTKAHATGGDTPDQTRQLDLLSELNGQNINKTTKGELFDADYFIGPDPQTGKRITIVHESDSKINLQKYVQDINADTLVLVRKYDYSYYDSYPGNQNPPELQFNAADANDLFLSGMEDIGGFRYVNEVIFIDQVGNNLTINSPIDVSHLKPPSPQIPSGPAGAIVKPGAVTGINSDGDD